MRVPYQLRGVTEIILEKLRQQDGAAVEHHAEDKAESDGRSEIPFAEQTKIQDGIFHGELANDQQKQGDDGNK